MLVSLNLNLMIDVVRRKCRRRPRISTASRFAGQYLSFLFAADAIGNEKFSVWSHFLANIASSFVV